MERLGVRSLDGLNLDEALGLLRRQLTPSSAAPEPSRATGAPASGDDAPKPLAAPAPEPPSGTFFDEEDDYDLTVIGTPEEDDDAESTYGIAQDEDEEGTLAHATDDEPDELRLDEVPDFGTERGATPAASPRAHSRSTQMPLPCHSGPARVSWWLACGPLLLEGARPERSTPPSPISSPTSSVRRRLPR